VTIPEMQTDTNQTPLNGKTNKMLSTNSACKKSVIAMLCINLRQPQNIALILFVIVDYCKRCYRFEACTWKLLSAFENNRLIDWLFNGKLTTKGQFVPTAGEGNKQAQSAKDGQRDTMHNTSRYTITM